MSPWLVRDLGSALTLILSWIHTLSQPWDAVSHISVRL